MTKKDTKEIITDIGLRTWQFTYDRRMSFQRMRLFNYGYCVQLSKFFGVDLNSEIYRIRDGNVSVYYELNDHQKAFSDIQNKLSDINSIELIGKINETIVTYYEEFKKFIEVCPVNYQICTNKELSNFYEEVCGMNKKISLPTWLLYLYFEEILTAVLKEKIVEKIKDIQKVENILSIISRPTRITPLDFYHKDLYRVVLGEQRIEQVAKKYVSWGVYDVNYEVPEVSLHLKKVENITIDKAKLLIDDLDKKYALHTVETEKIKKEWEKDTYIYKLINLFCFYADFKDWKNFYREQSSYKLKFLFKEIAKRLSLSVQQVSFLTEEETHNVLNGGIVVKPGELDKRINNSGFLFLRGELSIVIDEADLYDLDSCLKVNEESIFKGVSAYGGVIKGEAKIIFSTDDFSKINDGDIIVSSTTRPDYLPYMKKAGGFITNEGGLLSHAAILARELKKPCIIGTKIATKVLRDGDLVEVDADKGVVKILKKA